MFPTVKVAKVLVQFVTMRSCNSVSDGNYNHQNEFIKDM